MNINDSKLEQPNSSLESKVSTNESTIVYKGVYRKSMTDLHAKLRKAISIFKTTNLDVEINVRPRNIDSDSINKEIMKLKMKQYELEQKMEKERYVNKVQQKDFELNMDRLLRESKAMNREIKGALLTQQLKVDKYKSFIKLPSITSMRLSKYHFGDMLGDMHANGIDTVLINEEPISLIDHAKVNIGIFDLLSENRMDEAKLVIKGYREHLRFHSSVLLVDAVERLRSEKGYS